jgi:hypothetical protein
MLISRYKRSIFILEKLGLYTFSLFIAHTSSQVPQPVHLFKSAAMNFFSENEDCFKLSIFFPLESTYRFGAILEGLFLEFFWKDRVLQADCEFHSHLLFLVYRLEKPCSNQQKYGDYSQNGVLPDFVSSFNTSCYMLNVPVRFGFRVME